MAHLADGTQLPGKLFVVEGIDGSGKSTQLDLLRKWLVATGYCVAFSEWNSSPLVRRTTKRAKKKRLLTPTTSTTGAEPGAAAEFSWLTASILPSLGARGCGAARRGRPRWSGW